MNPNDPFKQGLYAFPQVDPGDRKFNQTRVNSGNPNNTPTDAEEQTAPLGQFTTSSGIPYAVHNVTQERPMVKNMLVSGNIVNPLTNRFPNRPKTTDPKFPFYTGAYETPWPVDMQRTHPDDFTASSSPDMAQGGGAWRKPNVPRVQISVLPHNGAPDRKTDPQGYATYMQGLEHQIVSDFQARPEASTTQAYRYNY